MTDAAPESSYWNDRIARKGRYAGVGHVNLSDRVNRRRKESLFRVLDGIYKTWMPDGLAGREVLDAGCGTGIYSAYYAARGAHVTGIDAAPSAVDMAKDAVPEGRFITGSLTDIPVEDGSQDAVHCFSVLYHIMDDADWQAALGEITRPVRPDGLLVVRCEKVLQNEALSTAQVLRAWPRYEDAFTRAGFRLVDEHSIVDMPRFIFRGRRFGPFMENPIERVTVWTRDA